MQEKTNKVIENLTFSGTELLEEIRHFYIFLTQIKNIRILYPPRRFDKNVN